MLSVAADLVSSRRSAAILEGLTQSKPRSLPEPRARPRGDKIRCKATAAARVVARRRRRVRDGLVSAEQFKQLRKRLGNEKVGIQVEAAMLGEQSNARDIARRDGVRNAVKLGWQHDVVGESAAIEQLDFECVAGVEPH